MKEGDEEEGMIKWRLGALWRNRRVKVKEKGSSSEVMSRWTLLFRDPTLERDFDAEHGNRYLRSQKYVPQGIE
jgi:hypothetical protein